MAKYQLQHPFFLLGILLGFLLLSSVSSSKSFAEAPALPRPVSIITEDWPPLNYAEDGEVKGFATEVIRLVMKEMKVDDPIVVLPGNRGLNVLDRGPRVLFYSFIQTPERKDLYKWIGPFANESIYLYKKRGSKLQIKTLEDAKKVHSVCCRDAGLVFNFLKKEGFKNLDVGTNATSIYVKAIHGRCDLAVGEPAGGVDYWLKKSNLSPDLLERTSVKISDSPLYFAASKDIPDAEIQIWQQALDKVKTTKVYEKLYREYQGTIQAPTQKK
ncbi:MAG: ABC transporter substrate-binding protein [Bdellovibrionales bacterium]|nr:ABC transporter substrate-binding protein [Bdellovibrionales bacterium]